MHPAVRAWVQFAVETYGPFRTVVELGSLNVNGDVRDLFGQVDEYTGVDLVGGPGVDAIADAVHFAPGVIPDCVVSCEVLEHTERARFIVCNAGHMLQTGGVLILTCATEPRNPHNAYGRETLDPDEFYLNVRPEWLAGWIADAGCDTLNFEDDDGDLRAIARRAPGRPVRF